MKYEINTVVSVKVREDIYTLAQARENHLFEFFDVKSSSGLDWSDIDLSGEKSLFCVYVADSKMRGVFSQLSSKNLVCPSAHPTERVMLSAWPVVGEKYSSVVNLVRLPDSFDSVDEMVLKENLLPKEDGRDLCKYELTGMVDSKYIKNRLGNYYQSGVNWDSQKDFIFKGDLTPIRGVNF